MCPKVDKGAMKTAMREGTGSTKKTETAGGTDVPGPKGKGRKAARVDNPGQRIERWEGSKGNKGGRVGRTSQRKTPEGRTSLGQGRKSGQERSVWDGGPSKGRGRKKRKPDGEGGGGEQPRKRRRPRKWKEHRPMRGERGPGGRTPGKEEGRP